MRRTWWRVLALFLFSSGLISAQEPRPSFAYPAQAGAVESIPTEAPQVSPLTQTAATTPVYIPPSYGPAPTFQTPPPNMYASPATEPTTMSGDAPLGLLRARWLFEADYLLWWVRKGDTPMGGVIGVAPVSDFANSTDGTLPNLTPVDSRAQSFDFGAQSGLRLALTGYLDDDQGWGFDASWFQFLKQSVGSSFASSGDPLLGPTYTGIDGSRNLILASFPAALTIGDRTFHDGRAAVVSAESSDRLWGAEINARMRLPAIFCDRLFLIGGFRTVQWGEGITIDTTSVPLPGSSAVSAIDLRDSFTAFNQFYGGQIGIEGRAQFGRFSLDVTSKFGLGGINEQIKIAGDTTIATAGSVTHLNGGVLAQGTNMGTWTSGRLTWLNEVTVKGGYNLTNNIRATIGYNFLYLDDVVRASNAIDTVDPRGVQVLSAFDPKANVMRPAPPTLQESRWWVQGLTFGVDVSF